MKTCQTSLKGSLCLGSSCNSSKKWNSLLYTYLLPAVLPHGKFNLSVIFHGHIWSVCLGICTSWELHSFYTLPLAFNHQPLAFNLKQLRLFEVLSGLFPPYLNICYFLIIVSLKHIRLLICHIHVSIIILQDLLKA